MPKPKVIIAKLGLTAMIGEPRLSQGRWPRLALRLFIPGIRQTPSQVIETAIQEDAKLIGISILSGSHMELIGELMRIMRERA
jgi:Methylmalonyl-CoA mutase, C-terminal domain/subunit (cobalamin-binding)